MSGSTTGYGLVHISGETPESQDPIETATTTFFGEVIESGGNHLWQ